MDTSVPPNALSGILFVLYVLAALALTAFLFSDLVRLASPGRTGTKAPSVTPQAWLLGLFALISFSLLSYNMLRFLLVHYRDWSVVRGLHLAPAGSWASFVSNDANLQNLAANVWQWLTEAGLFERFARELAGTEPALWWVQCALLHSVLVAVYLEIEGTRREVPHLWAYHALAQILPFSFVQNIFLLAIRLKPFRKNKDGSLQTAPPGRFWPLESLLQVGYSLPVGIGIMYLWDIIDQAKLLPTIFVVRLLIFQPHWLIKPTEKEGISTSDKPIATRQMDDTQAWDEWHHQYKWAYRITTLTYLLTVMSVIVEGGQAGGLEKSISARITAARASPAVAALGFDWLWGLTSLLIAGRLGGPPIMAD